MHLMNRFLLKYVLIYKFKGKWEQELCPQEMVKLIKTCGSSLGIIYVWGSWISFMLKGISYFSFWLQEIFLRSQESWNFIYG